MRQLVYDIGLWLVTNLVGHEVVEDEELFYQQGLQLLARDIVLVVAVVTIVVRRHVVRRDADLDGAAGSLVPGLPPEAEIGRRSPELVVGACVVAFEQRSALVSVLKWRKQVDHEVLTEKEVGNTGGQQCDQTARLCLQFLAIYSNE